MINCRWKHLDKLVREYNVEAGRINMSGQGLGLEDLRIRKLSPEGLRERGIEYDELWDVDRMASTSDWARFRYVREGIDAYFLLKRVEEERGRLQLHAKRTNRWLCRQTNVLINYISEGGLGSVRKQFAQDILLQRDKVAAGMLQIKYGDLLEPQSRTELEGIFSSSHQYFGVVRPNFHRASN
jgi:hypothetical protein